MKRNYKPQLASAPATCPGCGRKIALRRGLLAPHHPSRKSRQRDALCGWTGKKPR